MTAEVRSNNQLPNRTPAAGKIVYTVNTEKQVIRDPAGNVVFQGPLTLKLVAGQTSVDLPASDDLTLQPSGFTFTATEQLDHVAKSNYRVVEFQTVDGQVRYLADYADGDEIALDPSYGASLNGVIASIDAIRDGSDPALAASIDDQISSALVAAEKFGPTGTANDTATIQAGIDALAAQGGGTLLLNARRTYKAAGLILKQGVQIYGWTVFRPYHGSSDGYPTRIQAPAGSTGWIIDTPAGHINSCGLKGLLIEGPQHGYSSQLGGIRLRDVNNAHIEAVTVQLVSDSALYQGTGISTHLDDCFFQSDFSARTLSQVTGAVDMGGTDHYLHAVQANAVTNGAVLYPSFYRAAVHWRASTSWIYDTNGEFADVGWYVATGATLNRFIGARGDFNAGHGWYVLGSFNIFSACHVIANSQAATNAYDGLHLAGVGNRTQGLIGGSSGAANLMRYYYNDQAAFGPANATFYANTASGVTGPADNVGTDLINHANLYAQVWPNGAGDPSLRPPSRYCAGGTWWDSLNGRPTFSDGSRWRDAAGIIAGNRLTPNDAVMRDDASRWGVSAGCSAPTRVRAHPSFGVPNALAISANSAGAAANTMQISNSAKSPVIAGETYQFLCYTRAVTTGISVNFNVIWWDNANAVVGSVINTTGATNSTSVTKYAPTPLVAPAGAVTVQIYMSFTRTGLGVNETHHLSKVHVVRVGTGGAPGDYLEP